MNNSQFVDLSLPVDNGSQVFPGDPPVKITPITSIQKDGFRMHSFYFGGHAGTHIDSQSHFMLDGKNLNEYPPERFTGEGMIIDARGKRTIHVNILRNITVNKEVVFFWTNQIKKKDESSYFSGYPIIGKTLAARLINMGVKIVGIDGPSIDNDPFPVHRLLLAFDVLIIENLCNLDLLYNKNFRVYAFPLNVPTDGVPVRVIAQTEAV